jgi:HAE1 family hydrophobic/amphiphilic exporter-1
MWRFSKWALKSRPLTIIATIVISGVSIWALMGLKMELIPDIEFPYATIVTIYPDASPQMVAEKVTSPIENIAWQRWSGKSLKHLTSVSSEGISVIMAEFEFGTDMNGVISTLKQELDGLSLPPEVVNLPQITGTIDSNPQVIPINLSMLPLKMISVSGNLPAEELRRIVDTTLVPALADVDGVLSVQAEGGASDQIVVIPDTSRMVEHGISMSQILALLPQEAGSLEAIASTPLNEQGVLISDVAAINKSPSPLSVITRFNGKASIGLSVVKEDNANTVDVSDNIGVALDNVIPSLPEGIEVTGVFDQSDFIKDSVSELWNKAIVGGILAVVVVFIFLRAVRASLLTAISVPLSVLIGFLCMYFSASPSTLSPLRHVY